MTRLRRLEQDSGLKHRPLSAWDEVPLAGGAESRGLWEAHRRRLATQVRSLRPLGRNMPLGMRL